MIASIRVREDLQMRVQSQNEKTLQDEFTDVTMTSMVALKGLRPDPAALQGAQGLGKHAKGYK